MNAHTGLPYAVVEDNGGRLTLFVFGDADRQTAVYAYTGLEYETPEDIAALLRGLEGGDIPQDADDEGVVGDPQAFWLEVDEGDIVADDEGIYGFRMGTAADRALRVPLYAEAIDNLERWDGASVCHLEVLLREAREYAPEDDGKPDTSAIDQAVLRLGHVDRNLTLPDWPDWPELIAVDEAGHYLAWSDEDWLTIGYLPDGLRDRAA
ncbi:hypothetical protein HFO84_00005 [Rhizobium leguminosarum]|uniref:hypothetical protein n=1 Tax=Rhizobium leguminosarum TaxID=384 RepID=UPI001C976016|nr:hypothetical protein [Rhizobium leguminosarum]MBY5475713.1 hypothetical protein [Rhizobium leguminosarum]